MRKFKNMIKMDALVFILGFSIVLLNPQIAYGLMYLVLVLTGIGMFQSYYLGLKRKPKNTKSNTNVKLKIDTRLTPHRIVNIFIVGAITLLFSMALMHKTLVFQRVYLSLIASSLMMLLSLYVYNKINGITQLKNKYKKEYFKFSKFDIGYICAYFLFTLFCIYIQPKDAFLMMGIALFFIALTSISTIQSNIRKYNKKHKPTEMKEVTKLLEVQTNKEVLLVTQLEDIVVKTVPKHLSDKAIYQDTDCIITEFHTEKCSCECNKVTEIAKEHQKLKNKSLLLCMLGLTFAFIGGMSIELLYPTNSVTNTLAQCLVITIPAIGGMAYGYGIGTIKTFGKYVLSVKPNEKVTDETKN